MCGNVLAEMCVLWIKKKSRLSLQDFDFIEDVESDVVNFVAGETGKRVLVFPPVNNYRRFLIHKLIDEQFPKLATFSIGLGESRRPVVCFKKDYKQVPPSISTCDRLSKIETGRTGSCNCPVQPKRERRSSTMPSISIYRPPAARRLLEQSGNCSSTHEKGHILEKHNCKCPPVESSHTTEKGAPSGICMFKNAISSIRTQSEAVKCKSIGSKGNEASGKSDAATGKVTNVRQRRPDMQVYIPKARRGFADSPKAETVTKISKTPSLSGNVLDLLYDGEGSTDMKDRLSVDVEEPKKPDELNNKNGSGSVLVCESSRCDSNVNYKKENFNLPKKRNCDLSEWAENDSRTTQCLETSHNETCGRKFSLPQKPEVHHISPTSLWIEAQNEVSHEDYPVPESSQQIPNPVEISSSADSSEPNSLKGSLEKIYDSNKEESVSGKKKVDGVHFNREECDWESMFDENGECLDPTLLEQLSSAVGAVTIEKPKSNYDSYKTKTLDMVSNEFPHVIEIYNFPPEFQIQDLMTVFSQFKNTGFEIKWVDDTHALGIFSNSQVVSQVLELRHPFVKTRSLKDGTMLSKEKARRSAEHLLPYKPRPDTCPALARRLVSGALGVRLPVSREEREAERKILTQAREKKKLEAKQREEAWEGTFH